MTSGPAGERHPEAGTRPPPAEVCAIVLSAGAGTRLRPLTETVPKALCPVGNVPLLDRALDRLAGLGLTGPSVVAVNAGHLGDQIVRHAGDRATLSVEADGLLDTAGGIGNLRWWIDGRAVLVGNADAYLAAARTPGPDIAALLADWDGHTVRILGCRELDPSRAEFDGHRFAGFSLIPWRRVRSLPVGPSSLVEQIWRPAEADGELRVVTYPGRYLDTGTPGDYLAANLHAAVAAGACGVGHRAGLLVHPDATVTGDCAEAVIGAGAVVRGTVRRAVVWPGGVVDEGEVLTDAIRAGRHVTVRVRP